MTSVRAAPLLPMRLFAPHEIYFCFMCHVGSWSPRLLCLRTGFVLLFIFSRVSRWLMKPHKFFTSRVYHEARIFFTPPPHEFIALFSMFGILDGGASWWCVTVLLVNILSLLESFMVVHHETFIRPILPRVKAQRAYVWRLRVLPGFRPMLVLHGYVKTTMKS